MRVEYTKWDGRLHWHFEVERLGRDQYGLWVGGRKGCRLQRGNELTIAARCDFVCLVPAEGTWIATFHREGDVEIYIDVTSAPTCSDDTIRAIDLDLDVIRWRDGRVSLDDEDEFIEHRAEFGYPDHVAMAAQAAAASLMDSVRGRVEPFGDAPSSWLARVR